MSVPDSARETGAAIASVQRPDGSIPWYADGHADPWNHVEAAMGLDVAGLHREAERAYRWLSETQRPDGAWAISYRDGQILDHTLDANFCAYIAAGLWHHLTITGDDSLADAIWPVVERAIDFTLGLQRTDGAIQWARDEHYREWPGALLTSSSCIHLSLRCAVALAETVGEERPDWELSLASLGERVATCSGFEPKDRFSMDWYYPVLGGALAGEGAHRRIDSRWDEFVIEGRGCRCVNDQPWVTTGETAELILVLDLLDRREAALSMFEGLQHLRDDDGHYWTGATHPHNIVWPREKPTWGSGSVLLAADALFDLTPASGFFRGECFPDLQETSTLT